MSATKTIPMKLALSLISDHANGRDDDFKRKAVELAEELSKTDSELSEYILAQFNLVPTFTTGKLEAHHEVRNGDFVTFKGFPNIPDGKQYQLYIVDGRLKINEVRPM